MHGPIQHVSVAGMAQVFSTGNNETKPPHKVIGTHMLSASQNRHDCSIAAWQANVHDYTEPVAFSCSQAMELQAEAERRKRASILESEGQRQAKINVAEGDKQQASGVQGKPGGLAVQVKMQCTGGSMHMSALSMALTR